MSAAVFTLRWSGSIPSPHTNLILKKARVSGLQRCGAPVAAHSERPRKRSLLTFTFRWVFLGCRARLGRDLVEMPG